MIRTKVNHENRQLNFCTIALNQVEGEPLFGVSAINILSGLGNVHLLELRLLETGFLIHF